ncbi:MAG: SRPBCC domain-containing protein [Candidatus Dormiibacterota bacterium]
MNDSFVAEKSITIHASADAVWQALTDPEMVRQYMHGTNLETDWQVGSPITWKGEWQGRTYEDKGTVLEVNPRRRLTMTHWSPMAGKADEPDNYHTVTYELAPQDGTTVLTVKQDNNPSQEDADEMAESNWGPVLEGLKAVAESRHAAGAKD